jgi:hypothetical protein
MARSAHLERFGCTQDRGSAMIPCPSGPCVHLPQRGRVIDVRADSSELWQLRAIHANAYAN